MDLSGTQARRRSIGRPSASSTKAWILVVKPPGLYLSLDRQAMGIGDQVNFRRKATF